MSDKFDMKLVIDAVTTPLLHARLTQSNSYRERAALLRSLAESALRRETVPVVHAADRAAVSHNDPEPASSSRPPVTGLDDRTPITGDAARSAINETDAFRAHDVDQIADAFGSFF